MLLLLLFYVSISIISSLSPAVQKLMSLLFGTWFRIVNHSEFNTMSSESVAKSVAGSLFHTCAEDPVKVDHAVHILQILIDDFGVGKMFGRKNIQYFTETTHTGINVREKYQYELSVPAEKSMTECKQFSSESLPLIFDPGSDLFQIFVYCCLLSFLLLCFGQNTFSLIRFL